ncbi:polyphosphate--glucose phosphotransferase [Demequina zhanjiangensis]|uniref:ROK family protein n=1 Tax=Demequina zhanjiangensis TaxID=3051659 RepID=A0ABT8G0F5_9MICO|nr:ROK family protein [Demequina sp. SYSU T00b26]MDN4472613.1 ROK family protein [Demequina sp. SYSU T00b26]
MSKNIAIGVDIGGSGIKAAPVNLKNGKFTDERYRIPTPQPATPEAVGKTVAKCISRFEPSRKTPIGVAFPGVIQHGVVKTAANVDDSWIGVNLRELIRDYAGHDVHVLNDADAAGFGEYRYGAAHGQDGSIFLATLGTGVGTAMIVDGTLVPNLELGHLEIDGHDAEDYAAESARARHDLDWDGWIPHLQRYFSEVERLFWPDMIIVGGGVSKSSHMFLPRLTLRAPIIPAELLNGAGIVGAAAAAHAECAKEKARAKEQAKQAEKQAKKAAKRGAKGSTKD